MAESILLLGIDTCGPSGSVALGRWAAGAVEILGQIELEGRSYSATLVAAVDEVLSRHGVGLRELGAIVAVSGPGSFTGVRVGLSAVKGLAEAARAPGGGGFAAGGAGGKGGRAGGGSGCAPA